MIRVGNQQNSARFALRAAMLLVLGSHLTGCALIRRAEEEKKQDQETFAARETEAPEPNSPEAQLAQKNAEIQKLQARIAQMDTQVQELKGRLGVSDARLERQNSGAPKNLPSDFNASKAATDPESGLTTDSAVLAYRQGKILFDGEKYPEAILALSAFLERYPRHALGGSAQYYLALSYDLQSDCTSAETEYQKALTAYPYSPMSSQALKGLAICSEKLGKTAEARQYRARLMSLFPQSPAAGELIARPANESAPADRAIQSVSASQSASGYAGGATTYSAPGPAARVAPAQSDLIAPASVLDDVPLTAPQGGSP